MNKCFSKCYFSSLPLWACCRLKIQMSASVQAGHMQLSENSRIIKWYYCKILHLLRKVRWQKTFLRLQPSFCLLSYYMAWVKSWSQGRQWEFCQCSFKAFTTQISGFWESAWNKACQAAVRLPHGKEAQRSGVSFTSTKPRPSLSTQKYPLNILRKYHDQAASFKR